MASGRLRPDFVPGLIAPVSRNTFIALGSNLGDSPKLIRDAMHRLEALSDQPLLRSGLWRSSPINCPPGAPPFVNAVVGLVPRAGQTPEALLENLQVLEKEFGRQPKQVLNEPRLLDLDLIAFGRETRSTPRLTLPHPRAHQRRFVLEPLNEIAPDFLLPGQTKSIRQLLAGLHTEEVLTRLSC